MRMSAKGRRWIEEAKAKVRGGKLHGVDVGKLVAEIKKQVVADVRGHTVPRTVRSYSELHDYVDANMYGDGTFTVRAERGAAPGDEFDDAASNQRTDVLNVVFDRVDAWIKRGGLRRATAKMPRGSTARVHQLREERGQEPRDPATRRFEATMARLRKAMKKGN